MADTGFKLPQSVQEVTGVDVEPWTNPSNLTTDSQSSVAYNDLPKRDYSDFLIGYNYDFSSIPAGSTIDGIEVQVEHRGESTTLEDAVFRLYQNTTPVGDDKASDTAIGTAWVNDTYGGSTDVWNAGLSLADIQTSTFGMGVQYYNDTTPNALRWVEVNTIRIKVYYTAGSTGEDELGAADLDGTATLTSEGKRDRESASTIEPTATLTCIGASIPAGLYGIIDLYGTSELDIIGSVEKIHQGASELEALSTLEVIGRSDITHYGAIEIDTPSATIACIATILTSDDNTEAEFAQTAVNLVYGTDRTDWVNPENVFVDSQSVYAYSNMAGYWYSDRLHASNFDLSYIPDGAIIQGIELEIEHDAETTGQATYELYLSQDGTAITANRASEAGLSTSWSTDVVGGAEDLWGLDYTAIEIKDSGFGVLVRYQNTSSSSKQVNVNYITLKVYFSRPAEGGVYGGIKLTSDTTLAPVDTLATRNALATLTSDTILACDGTLIQFSEDILGASEITSDVILTCVGFIYNKYGKVSISSDATLVAKNSIDRYAFVSLTASSELIVHHGAWGNAILSSSSELSVSASIVGGFICKLTNDDDDATQLTNGSVALNSPYRYIQNDEWLIYRFPSVVIPDGEVIDTAYFYTKNKGTTTTSTSIYSWYMEDSDNSLRPTTATDNISDRSRTTGIIDNIQAPVLNIYPEFNKLIDLKSEVNEVINRVGWESGDPLSVIAQCIAGNTWLLYFHDQGTAYGSELRIVFQPKTEISLASTTTLSVNAKIEVYGAVSLTSTATLTTDVTTNKFAEVDIDADATLASLGRRLLAGATAVTISTTLAVAGNVDRSGALELSTTSAITSIGKRDRESSSTLSATTILASIASRDRHIDELNLSRETLTDDNGDVLTDDNGDDLYVDVSYTFLRATGYNASSESASLPSSATINILGQREYSADSALTGDTTLTVLGMVYGEKFGTSALDATAILEAIGERDRASASDLTADVTLEVAGEKYGSKEASADLDGVTILDVAGERDRASGADFLTEALLVVQGIADAFASAELDNTATLDVEGECVREALAELTQTTTLTAIPETTGIKVGRADLSATSTVTVIAERDRETSAELISDTTLDVIAEKYGELLGALDLEADATLDVEGERDRFSSLTLSGDTTLDVDGESYGTNYGQADLDASATLSVIVSVDRHALEALTASAILGVTSEAERHAQANLSSTTIVFAIPSTDGELQGRANISSTATLTVLCEVERNAYATLFGNVSLTVIGLADNYAFVELETTAELDVIAFAVRNGQLELSSDATVTVSSVGDANGQASLLSGSQVVIIGRADNNFMAELQTNATLTCIAIADNNASTELEATATLDAISSAIRNASAELTSSATLSATPFTDGELNGRANLVSTTTLEASCEKDLEGEANLTTTSLLEASGERVRQSRADLSASTTLEVVGKRDRESASELDGTATLEVVGDTVTTHFGEIELSGTATITASPSTDGVQSGRASLTSSATLELSGEMDYSASVELTSTTELSAKPTAEGVIYAESTLEGASTLTVTADPSQYAEADISSSTTLTITAVVDHLASVSIEGSAELRAVSEKSILAEASISSTATVLLDVGYPQPWQGSSGTIVNVHRGAIITLPYKGSSGVIVNLHRNAIIYTRNPSGRITTPKYGVEYIIIS